MITSLTPEQKSLFPVYVKKWIDIGLSTKPADRPRAEKAIAGLYRLANLKEPRVIWLPCPISAALSVVCYAAIIQHRLIEKPGKSSAVDGAMFIAVDSAVDSAVRSAVGNAVDSAVFSAVGSAVDGAVGNAVRSAVRSAVDSAVGSAVGNAVRSSVDSAVGNAVDSAVGNAVRSAGYAFFGGSLRNAGYSSLADYFNEVCAVAIDRNFLEMTESAGFYWTLDDVCFVSDRPAQIHRDQAGRLHCETAPAIAYSGTDWGLYCWHGFTIPPSHHWIIADKAKLSPDSIDAETNAELRRVMLEVYGFDRYFAERKAKVMRRDVDGNGHARRLLSAKVGGDTIRVVEVLNGSLEPDGTRRKFLLGAMPGKTPHEAIAASYGIAPQHYREAVRT